MKKLIKIFTIILIILSLTIGFVYADEEEIEEAPVEQTEQVTTPAPEPEKQEPISIVVKAKVKSIIEKEGEESQDKQKVKVVVTNSDYIDEEFELEYNLNYDSEGKIKSERLKEGSKVLLKLTINADGTKTAQIEGFNRTGIIVLLVLLFCASLCLVCGKYGIKLLVSLLITALSIWFILIKLMELGFNSVIVAFVTSAIIITLTSILFGGVHRKAFASALGAIGGILISCICTAIFANIAHLSGVTEQAIELSSKISNFSFDLKSIIFASSVLASTGICLDISMHITNLLYSEKSKTEDMPMLEVLKNGIKKGKDVIGSKAIILFLAFCASSLSLLVLFLGSDMHIVEMLNKDIISEFIIVSLCSSIGMVCTIPMCSLTFAFFNRRKIIYNVKASNKVEGKRSLKIK